MARRRFRTKGRRRARPRVHWVDTFQDGIPILIDCFPGYDSDPSHNKVLVVPLIRQRTPQQVEDLSSVLEGKDEGFRLRRIVGDLLFLAGTVYISNAEARLAFTRYSCSIRWGIMVHPITGNRNFDNLTAGGEYLFNPAQSVSMSDSWLITRSVQLYNYGPFDRPSLGRGLDENLRDDNSRMAPDGTFIDVTVNRRVGAEEDVSLFLTWNSDLSPGGPIDTVGEPFYQSNLRMLVSR